MSNLRKRQGTFVIENSLCDKTSSKRLFIKFFFYKKANAFETDCSITSKQLKYTI